MRRIDKSRGALPGGMAPWGQDDGEAAERPLNLLMYRGLPVQVTPLPLLPQNPAPRTSSRRGPAGAHALQRAPMRPAQHIHEPAQPGDEEAGSTEVPRHRQRSPQRERADLAWKPRDPSRQDASSTTPGQDSLAPLLLRWWESIRTHPDPSLAKATPAALMAFSRWAIEHAAHLAPTTLNQSGELLDLCDGLAAEPPPYEDDRTSAERSLNLLLPLWLLHLSRPRTQSQRQRAQQRLDVLAPPPRAPAP